MFCFSSLSYAATCEHDWIDIYSTDSEPGLTEQYRSTTSNVEVTIQNPLLFYNMYFRWYPQVHAYIADEARTPRNSKNSNIALGNYWTDPIDVSTLKPLAESKGISPLYTQHSSMCASYLFQQGDKCLASKLSPKNNYVCSVVNRKCSKCGKYEKTESNITILQG